MKAFQLAIRNFANFDDRTTRSEFWFFVLQFYVVYAALLFLGFWSLLGLWATFGFIPLLSATCRRLHDTNKSGWNQLWVLTGIGALVVLIWLCTATKPGENRFGSVAKGDVSLA